MAAGYHGGGIVLKPIYEKFEEDCKGGNVDESVKYYHSQAVVVEKGKKAWYGKERELFRHSL